MADGRTVWGAKVCNSWGEKWGKHGVCVIPETYFKDSAIGGMYAIRATNNVAAAARKPALPRAAAETATVDPSKAGSNWSVTP